MQEYLSVFEGEIPLYDRNKILFQLYFNPVMS